MKTCDQGGSDGLKRKNCPEGEGRNAEDAETAGSRAIDMATLNARCANNLMKRETMMIQRLT